MEEFKVNVNTSVMNYRLVIDYLNGVTVVYKAVSYAQAELFLRVIKRAKFCDIAIWNISHISHYDERKLDNPVYMEMKVN